jgi:hypothetical protein
MGVVADRPAIWVRVVLVPRHPDRAEILQQNRAEPGRVLHDVESEADGRVEGKQEPVLRVVFAVWRHDRVRCNDQRLEPVVLGTLDQLVGQLPLLPDVELEPEAEIGLPRDLLHRCHRAGRESEGDFCLRGSLG